MCNHACVRMHAHQPCTTTDSMHTHMRTHREHDASTLVMRRRMCTCTPVHACAPPRMHMRVRACTGVPVRMHTMPYHTIPHHPTPGRRVAPRHAMPRDRRHLPMVSSGSISALSRHRRRNVHCAGMGMPVLNMTASPWVGAFGTLSRSRRSPSLMPHCVLNTGRRSSIGQTKVFFATTTSRIFVSCELRRKWACQHCMVQPQSPQMPLMARVQVGVFPKHPIPVQTVQEEH